MGVVLDTCVLIRAERQGALPGLGQWAKEGAYISAITASELLVGMHRANSEAHRLRRVAFVDMVLAKVPALDFTLEAARIHAEAYALLAAKGQLIGAHDLIIAATALANGCKVLTYNEGEFARVPGLQLISPSEA